MLKHRHVTFLNLCISSVGNRIGITIWGKVPCTYKCINGLIIYAASNERVVLNRDLNQLEMSQSM